MRVNNKIHKNIIDNLNDGVFFVSRSRKIKYWNKGAENLAGYSSSEVIGKRCSDNILMHVNDKGESVCGTKQCPLRIVIESGVKYEVELYILHRKGHRIPTIIRVTPIKDSKNNTIGAVEMFLDNSPKVTILDRIKELEKKTLIDHLTELGNRHYAEMNLQSRISELKRFGWPFGVLFIDIDNFKKVNDAYGHDVGDDVLKVVAKTISSNLRQFDFAGRWGGEEFVVVAVNIDKEKLQAIANKIRLLTEESRLIVGTKIIKVTVSIGATVAKPDDTISAIIKRADQLMYQSKTLGRNRVSIELSKK